MSVSHQAENMSLEIKRKTLTGSTLFLLKHWIKCEEFLHAAKYLQKSLFITLVAKFPTMVWLHSWWGVFEMLYIYGRQE